MLHEAVSRRAILIGAALSLPGIAGAAASAWSHDATSDDRDWRLLMGPGAFAPLDRVSMQAEPVDRSGPFLSDDHACGQNPYVFGSLLFDPDRQAFRLWYQTYNKAARPRTGVLYAESRTGTAWTFPFQSGRCTLRPGSNVVLEPAGAGDLYSPSVVFDPDDIPARRYKMAYSDFTGGTDTYTNGGVCVAFSPDGLNWTRYSGNPALAFRQTDRAASDVVDVCRNPRTGEFELYAKGWTGWRRGRDGVVRPRYRTIVRSISRDFVRWSEPEVVVNHHFDQSDPQSYGMPVSFVGDLRVGQLRSYKLPGDSTIDIRLLVSRDGKQWTYPVGMTPFIGLGAPGSFDSGMIMTTPLALVGDRHFAVSGGWTGSHEDRTRRAALGLVTIPRHRFVGVTGVFQTPLLSSASAKIEVNAIAGKPIAIELVDETGAVMASYTREAMVPLEGDSLAHEVRPRQGRLPNRPFAVRLHAPAGARVFAYRTRGTVG